jgi:adenylylsulfate kinase-like enzyme
MHHLSAPDLTPVFWFFGRSASGKTTLSRLIADRLSATGVPTFCIDGDDLRSGLCSDLGFSEEARTENHRRAAELAAFAVRQGAIVLAATMAPKMGQRAIVRQVLGSRLRWIYVDAELQTCALRDPKGIYKRARGSGNPLDFAFDVPEPHHYHLRLDTEHFNSLECSEMGREYILAELAKAKASSDRME